ncbi:MAG: hypothetical protein IIW35_02315 [Bacteroidaceae bacterium]|jgi:hypothetical protein|nr:hypothetical protein [Bacteroidaceae bacterium]MBQ5817168.1 hypothetical protein [Bacteroidaceae bacterium]
MLKFILGHFGYFITMLFFIALCFILEAPISGKFLMLGFVSFGMGIPAGKKTRFGLTDKRYKEKPTIWWQVLVGVAIFAIGILLMEINGDFNQ